MELRAATSTGDKWEQRGTHFHAEEMETSFDFVKSLRRMANAGRSSRVRYVDVIQRTNTSKEEELHVREILSASYSNHVRMEEWIDAQLPAG